MDEKASMISFGAYFVRMVSASAFEAGLGVMPERTRHEPIPAFLLNIMSVSRLSPM